MNSPSLRKFTQYLHQASMMATALIAVGAVGYTLLCVFGLMPWFTASATFGEVSFDQAGQFAQIGFTALMVMFASFLPTTGRVSLLENSHRKFHMNMEDVARAFHSCHAADRTGVFKLSSEFDSVRERLVYLRDHPKLGTLEPSILEIAAQMSHQSKELAEVYSDENIERAKTFLRQRNEEISQQKERITNALKECREIEQWAAETEKDDSAIARDLTELEERLAKVLSPLGFEIGKSGANVLPLSGKKPQKKASEKA